MIRRGEWERNSRRAEGGCAAAAAAGEREME